MSVSEENPSDPSKEVLTWRQTHWLFLPPDDDVYVLLRLQDYERLQRYVGDESSPQDGNFPVAYWSLFSTSVAIGASVPVLLWTTGMPIWLAAAYIGTASVLFAIGLVLFFVGRILGKKNSQAASERAEEMHGLGKRIEVRKTLKPGHGESMEE